MSAQPHESVATMSEQRLRQLHLYKELMSNEEARDRYQELRRLGATPSRARQWRHWSPYHYQLILNYLLQTNNTHSSVSQQAQRTRH